MKASVANDFREPVESAAHLSAYLDAATAVEKVMAGKQRRANFLAARADSVADLGCGTGEMIALFETNARWQRIVGVDHNDALLGHARGRSEDPRVELVRADAGSLPFADGELGAVLVERTLQHVEDPPRVLSEAARVVAPGGTVLVVEPDWSTLGIDGAGDATVTASVLGAVRGMIRHPVVGRGLRGLLNRAGLVDVVVDAEFHETADLDVARLLGMIDEGVEEVRAAGTLSAEALQAWQEGLGLAASSGDFSASLLLFVAVGRVPAR